LLRTELIDKEQCAGSEDAVRERINKLMDEWTYLTRKSSEKGEKLQEANRQRMYTAAVKDLEFWLGEVRANYFNVVSLKTVLGFICPVQALGAVGLARFVFLAGWCKRHLNQTLVLLGLILHVLVDFLLLLFRFLCCNLVVVRSGLLVPTKQFAGKTGLLHRSHDGWKDGLGNALYLVELDITPYCML